MPAVVKTRGVRDEPFKPLKLVIELGAGLRIALGQVQAANEDAGDGRLQVTAVFVRRIAGEMVANLH